MLTFARNKFSHRYLPMFFSVVLIVGAWLVYDTLKPQTKKAEADWYTSGGTWNYRKPITIDRNKINQATGTTTPLTNFPMLFSVTDADLKTVANGGKVGNADGSDILFTSSDGITKLNHEIESYASTTGATIMWVQIPSLVSTSDTTLYIYFGNASASSQQNATSTWDSNYKGVWHLPNGTTLTANDSTSNANNGTNTGTVATTGKINGGADFGTTGTNNIAIPNSTSLDFNGNVTLESWVYPKNTSNYHIIIAKGTSSTNRAYSMYLTSGNTSSLFLGFGNTTNLPGATALSTPWAINTWNHIVVTADGTNIKAYINGALAATVVSSVVSATLTKSTYLGYSPDDGTYNLYGLLDEVRISGSARSADWIKTEYLNQASPSTFYAYGAAGVQNRPAGTAGVGVNSRGASSLGWFATGGTWNYRKPITIDRNKINQATGTTTPLTNFPMLFSVTDADLKTVANGGKVGNADGSDILFTSSDGITKLNHEIESYASTTGATIMWVQIPSLVSTSDTTLYIYFGNASASDQQNVTSTWDSNYSGAWHLSNGTTLSGAESKNGNTMVFTGSPAAGTGQIDGAEVNTTATYGAVSGLNSFSSQTVTQSAWIFPTQDGSVNGGDILGKNYAITNPFGSFGMQFMVGRQLGFFLDDNGYINNLQSGITSLNTWHYVVMTVSTSTMTGYIDGVSKVTYTRATTMRYDNTKDYNLGSWGSNPGDTNEHFVGRIDEVRLSNIARSADWIKTEYLNQFSPSTFYAYGAVGVQNRASSTPLIKTRGGVKLR